MRRLLVYAPRVLPPSQTFIATQARALRRWQPFLIGRQLVDGSLDVGDLLFRDGTRAAPTVGRLQGLALRARRRIPSIPAAAAALRPDLVHAHFLTGGIEVTASLGRSPYPIVVTAHGFDATMRGRPSVKVPPHHWMYAAQRRRLLRRPVQFIAISRFIRDELIRHGADADRVTVHYTGVDTDYFCPDGSVDAAGVLFVGRLVAQKGVRELIEAMAILRHGGVVTHLTLIGDGPLRSECEELGRRERLDVRFLGQQPAERVRDEMRRAAVFCVPSRTDATGVREGLGMVFLEAQAVGLPVVTTRSGGIPEAVADARTGLLVDEGSSADLAAALQTVLTDDELRLRLADAARPRVIQHFDLARQTERLERLYDEWCGLP